MPSELSRRCPLEIFFQVFGFKGVCTVSAAKHFLYSSPATKDLRISASDGRLHQLQHWLQLLIKLLAVRARNTEARLLSNRPFWPRRLIWCHRKLLLMNQCYYALNKRQPFPNSQAFCTMLTSEGRVWERDYKEMGSSSFLT